MKKIWILWICLLALSVTAAPKTPLRVDSFGRCAFLQNEENAVLKVHVFNDSAKEVKDLQVNFSATCQKPQTVKVPRVPAKKWVLLSFQLETRLVPRPYPGKLVLKDAKGRKLCTNAVTLHIAKNYPQQMPVDIAWIENYKIYREMGFTASGVWAYLNLLKLAKTPESEIRAVNKISRGLDRRLVEGFQVMDQVFTRFAYGKFQPFTRQDNSRNPNPPRSEFDPTHRPNWKNVLPGVEKNAKYISSHPAVTSIVINSELRDLTKPSFTAYNKESFRKYSGGKAIPSSVLEKVPSHYDNIPEVTLNRIMPEDLDLYQYYQWFWRDGDGWNDLHRAMHKIYEKYAHKNFQTRFEPAVRCPPNWGSGSGLHQIAHWTYVNEYPQAVSVNISEMRAMAGGSPGQKIYPALQVITYGSAVAPRNKKVPNPPEWMKKFPKCVYPTLAPNLMEESLYLMLSRQTPAGFYLTAACSIYPETKFASKVRFCTNDQTRDALKKVDRELIKPYGPLLMRLPERPAQVAVYQGFASALFAGRAAWGWTNWTFHLGNILLKGNIPFDVIYDEHILRGDLSGYKAVLLPHADLLTARVLAKLRAFRENGGILLGDEFTCPALLTDGEMEVFTNPANRSIVQKMEDMRRIGKEIRQKLAALGCIPYAGSDNADIFTFVRSSREVDYLFAVNDKRTFGDYVGMYGLCMDKALPNSGKVFLRRKAGAVYELVSRKKVPFSIRNKQTYIQAQFKGNGGQVFLLLPEEISSVKIATEKKQAVPGEKVTLEGSVYYKSGKVIKGMLPVTIEVRDPAGKLTGDSTRSTIENGMFRKEVILPLNGAKGLWRVTFREDVSGRKASCVFSVK